ncbi:MAG: hypothetical protein V3T83_02820 [Acidobacteriota bacterium]
MRSVRLPVAIFWLLLFPYTPLAAEKIRLFVTNSEAWQIIGGTVNGTGFVRGGSSPQTAEIIKTFNKKCPEFIITMRPDKADFVVLIDREGGKGIARKDTKVVIFEKEGDALYSGSTRSIGGAVKDSCKAIRKYLEN